MSATNFFAHAAAHTIGDAFRPVTEGVRYVTNTVAPIHQPEMDELFHASIRGWIPEQLLTPLARLNGVVIDPAGEKAGSLGSGVADNMAKTWNRVYWSYQELPGQAEYRDIANRNLWPASQVQEGLIPYGYYTADMRILVQNLQFEIPGPSDLVRFSVRHVWEPDLLSTLGYDAEFPGKVLDYWHAAKGLDYPLFTGPFQAQIDKLYNQEGSALALANTYSEAGVSEPTWAKAYWWSHWILPSPGQAYQMWFRLNPERNPKWDAPEMEGQEFTFADLELLLRANDYAPKWRPLLAAISHPIPGIRFLRDFARNGVYEYEDVVDWARRWGYAPADQKNIADDVWETAKGAAQRKADRQCLTLAKAAYLAGILSDSDLLALLQQCGLAEDAARAQANAIVLADQIRRAKQIVSSVRSRFVRGKIDEGQARDLLSSAGIVASARDDFLVDWKLEQAETGREATIAQALKWACNGFITLKDFQTRAANLGYLAQDIAPLVAQVQLCQNTLLAKALAAAAKAEQQTLKQEQAAIKAAAQAIRQAQRDLASHGGPNKLREWFCQGFLTESDLFSRLRFLGWPDSDITRLVGDCKGVRDSKLPGLLTPPAG